MKYEDFTKLYPLSKTIRFELKPIGRTMENIESKGFLIQDKERENKYKKVKKIIDNYHKLYINRQLSNFSLKYKDDNKKDSLQEYYKYRNRTNITDKSCYEEVQSSLRKQIAKRLKDSKEYKLIDKKELFTQYLPEFVKDEEQELIAGFKNFTSYFTGFHQNRQNMYSDEAKSTAIAYRIIHENLPKFIDNMEIFQQILQIPEIAENICQLYKNFESYLNVTKIEEMFELEYFNEVLTQTQIEVYNALIGGRSEGDLKIKGLNEYINLYNQSHRDTRLPQLRVLYKQILSDREQVSWLPEQFNSGEELLTAVGSYYLTVEDYINNLKVVLREITNYNIDGIFIRNDQQLSSISNAISGDWATIQQAVIEDLKGVRKQKKSEDAEKYNEELKNLYFKQESFSIGYLKEISKLPIDSYFSNLVVEDSEINIFEKIANAYNRIQFLLTAPCPIQKRLDQDKEAVALLKEFLDTLITLRHYIKPLLGIGNEAEKDNRFYGEILQIWEQLNLVIPLYNKVRNYITRKPYSQEKIKINFNNSQLLGGWDKNKERDCLSIILRKDEKYYLGIIDKNHNKILDKYPRDGNCYEKMVYKLLPGANKMLPKVFFSKSRIEEFAPSKEVLEIYKSGTFKKGGDFNLLNCHKLIDFFKDSIFKHEDWSRFDYRFTDTKLYDDISCFYREVEGQGYKVTFSPISVSYINQLVEEGKLYLFQIYNKDFSEYSKGTPNLHTLYWRILFDERNLKDVVYQLNGGAELFYRKRSLKCYKPTHPAHMPIKNKNEYKEKDESVFEYDIIKNKRYTYDKFQFHVPITMNFKSNGKENINAQVRSYIHSADDIHIIGIDRGERNLLYLVVIDMEGRICEQISLNEIVNNNKGNIYKTNYHNLLNKREETRLQERQSWQTIEGIKELKEGYLSQVIHKIATLMIKYKAIVVLEDLNMGFMRGRQKVEKSVYQKFEKMLIDKLNYLVDKTVDENSSGGLLNAYQLTNKFDGFSKLGKQSGFLFYVPAWNTSKIDPVTGFVNLLDLRYESVDKAKVLFSKFDSIQYNNTQGRFEFNMDYDKFTGKASGTQTNWIIGTHGTRIETFRNKEKNNQWDNREVNLTKEMQLLLVEYGISLEKNLKDEIIHQDGKEFYERLLRLLRLTLQMRNSITGTNIDYIISPVTNNRGEFFDSRNGDITKPLDADANGAYNIARKGLMIVEQLKQTEDPQNIKFDLSNKQWLRFAQRNN